MRQTDPRRRRHRHASPSPERETVTPPSTKISAASHFKTAALLASIAVATVYVLYRNNYLGGVSEETLKAHPDTKDAFETLAKWFYPYSIVNMAHRAEAKCVGMASNMVFTAPFPIAWRASIESAWAVTRQVAEQDTCPADTEGCNDLIRSIGQFVVQQTGPRPNYPSLIGYPLYILATGSAFFSMISFTEGLGAREEERNRAADAITAEEQHPAPGAVAVRTM